MGWGLFFFSKFKEAGVVERREVARRGRGGCGRAPVSDGSEASWPSTAKL